jgi:hypothetical protein
VSPEILKVVFMLPQLFSSTLGRRRPLLLVAHGDQLLHLKGKSRLEIEEEIA